MEIKNASQALKYLWNKNFFDNNKRKLSEIKEEIKKELHCTFPDTALSKALKGANYLTREGKRGKYSYIQKHNPKGITLDETVFPETLVTILGRDFDIEIHDLNLNYGRSGNCTAFLLRKILEKLIFLTFAKNDLSDRLKDTNGDFVGLKTMLNLATTNKVQGKPFLMPKTAQKIEGIKFLGDISAHDYLAGVEMNTITPQMPFIITAYEELSKKL